ncbi:conserved hypothetical protein [Ricinus communis]|uniref:Uncharacterized protein n=1 Tax=Ricinus communis TaxID=3988 RepID=B9TMX0_RICCO|nr:conserved hypothetical protein [Ricinus communis]
MSVPMGNAKRLCDWSAGCRHHAVNHLPQGLRVAVPPLLGFGLIMLQATSLCFTVALPELVTRANQIGTATFMYMPVLILTALLYTCICVPSTLLVSRLERRLARHEA